MVLLLTTDAAVLMDFGYVTHAVHANSRLVRLASSLSGDKSTLTVAGPPDGNIYPPGPGWLFIVVKDVASTGVKVMIGDGKSPEVNEAALQKYVFKITMITVSLLQYFPVYCLRLVPISMMIRAKTIPSRRTLRSRTLSLTIIVL